MLSGQIQKGSLTLPPPPAGVREWPFVGEQLSAFWTGASENLGATLKTIAPHLKEAAGWLRVDLGGSPTGCR